jgi:hypothetical protein
MRSLPRNGGNEDRERKRTRWCCSPYGCGLRARRTCPPATDFGRRRPPSDDRLLPTRGMGHVCVRSARPCLMSSDTTVRRTDEHVHLVPRRLGRSEPLVPGEMLPWMVSSPGDERMTFTADEPRVRASAEGVPPIAVRARCHMALARAAVHGRNVPPGRADVTMKRPPPMPQMARAPDRTSSHAAPGRREPARWPSRLRRWNRLGLLGGRARMTKVLLGSLALWILVGGCAAFQRGDFATGNCSTAADTALVVVLGPVSYSDPNTLVSSCSRPT